MVRKNEIFHSIKSDRMIFSIPLNKFIKNLLRNQSKLWREYILHFSLHNILEPTRGVTFLNSGFKSDPHIVVSFNSTSHNKSTMVSIVASIVISKFLHYTILVTISGKRFFQENFNLKMTRIQRGVGSWMLLDALFHCWEESAGPRLKNVKLQSIIWRFLEASSISRSISCLSMAFDNLGCIYTSRFVVDGKIKFPNLYLSSLQKQVKPLQISEAGEKGKVTPSHPSRAAWVKWLKCTTSPLSFWQPCTELFTTQTCKISGSTKLRTKISDHN
jgi:hypothetical protein